MLALSKRVISCLLMICLTGCLGEGPKQTGGRLVGGVAGALAGSQLGGGKGKVFGAAIGALAGSFLGGAIGQRMDENDQKMAHSNMIDTLERAPDYQEQGWRNPNNNHAGTFKVTRTEELPRDHLVCRDYVQTVVIDGNQEKVHGRACRDIRDSRAAWHLQG